MTCNQNCSQGRTCSCGPLEDDESAYEWALAATRDFLAICGLFTVIALIAFYFVWGCV